MGRQQPKTKPQHPDQSKSRQQPQPEKDNQSQKQPETSSNIFTMVIRSPYENQRPKHDQQPKPTRPHDIAAEIGDFDALLAAYTKDPNLQCDNKFFGYLFNSRHNYNPTSQRPQILDWLLTNHKFDINPKTTPLRTPTFGDARSKYKYSPIAVCMIENQIELIEILFKHNVIDISDPYDYTSPSPKGEMFQYSRGKSLYDLILEADAFIHIDIIDLLHKNGVVFDARDKLDKNDTPLIVSIIVDGCSLHNLRYFIQLGIQLIDCGGPMTPLSAAAICGHTNILDELLKLQKKDENGNDVSMFNMLDYDINFQSNAFFAAIQSGDFYTVQHCIDNFQMDIGFICPITLNTALHQFALSSPSYTSSQLLKYIYENTVLKNLYEYDVQNAKKQTPLYNAILSQNGPCARLLIQAGAKITHDMFDETEFQTFYHYVASGATYTCSLEHFYLDPNFNINAPNKECYNLTPIQYAIFRQSYEGVKQILAHPQVNLDIVTKAHIPLDKDISICKGSSLLHLAAILGSYEIFQLLCSTTNCYHPHQVDSDKNAPIIYAITNDHHKIAGRLLETYHNYHTMKIQINNFVQTKPITILQFATSVNAIKCCEIFVNQYQLSPILGTPEWNPPIELASMYNSPNIISIFIPHIKDIPTLHLLFLSRLQRPELDKTNIEYLVKKYPQFLSMRENRSQDRLTALHYAVQESLYVVQYLHELGADLDVTKNHKPHDLQPLLHCVTGNQTIKSIEIADYLLKHLPRVGIEYRCEQTSATPLQAAVIAINLIMVKYLIDKGADPYKSFGFAPLTSIHLAIARRSPELVEYFLTKKRKVQGKFIPLFESNTILDEHGYSPFEYTVISRSIETIPILLQYGGDVTLLNQPGRRMVSTLMKLLGHDPECSQETFETLFATGLTPMEYFSDRDYTAIEEFIANDNVLYMKHFLQHNNLKYRFIGHNYTNPYTGWTLLHVAIQHNAMKCLDYILRQKLVPIDLYSKYGCTPLFHAILNEKLPIVELLLKYNANPFIITSTGSTILHFAASTINTKPTVIQWAVKKYPQLLEVKNNSHYTPLSIATRFGNFTIMKILQQAGAKFNTNSINGYNLFHQVAFSRTGKHHDIIEYLTKHMKPITIFNSIADDGSTPLTIACQCGNLMMMKYLYTTKKLPLNIITNNGWDVLHWVIISDDIDAIRWVLQQYDKDDKTKLIFNPNSINSTTGYNALHFAVLQMKLNAIKTLIEYKADPLIKTIKNETIIDLIQQAVQTSSSSPASPSPQTLLELTSTTSSTSSTLNKTTESKNIEHETIIQYCKQIYEAERKLHLKAEDIDNEVD